MATNRLLIKHLKGIGGSGAVGFGANRVDSIPDAMAKALEAYLDGPEENAVASAREEVVISKKNDRDEDGDVYREGLGFAQNVARPL